MTNNTRISGPVDVLAVLDRLIGNARTMAGMTGDPVMRDNLRDGEKARAAVAELIEADREYDRERGEWWGGERYEKDSYGVPGSDFFICLDCQNESGAGILNKGISHEPDCRVAALERAEERRAVALANIGDTK